MNPLIHAFLFSQEYTVTDAVVIRDVHRAMQFGNCFKDFHTKYAGLENHDHPFHIAKPSHVAWRESIEKYIADTYAPLRGGASNATRVLLAFHVAPSEAVAATIMQGNFGILSEVDAGFFGQGIYFTFDADYALGEYGKGIHGLRDIPLLVCAIVRATMRFVPPKQPRIFAALDSWYWGDPPAASYLHQA